MDATTEDLESLIRRAIREEFALRDQAASRSLLSTEENAVELRKSVRWTQEASRNGDIPAVKVGHDWRFDRDAVIAALSKSADRWSSAASVRRARRRNAASTDSAATK